MNKKKIVEQERIYLAWNEEPMKLKWKLRKLQTNEYSAQSCELCIAFVWIQISEKEITCCKFHG